MAASAMLSASTSAVCRDERLGYWNRIVGEAYDGIVIDADEKDDFEGAAEFTRIGPIEIARVFSSAAQVQRLHARHTGFQGSLLKLHVQESGDSYSHHAGHDEILRPGGFMLCDAERPYRLEFKSSNRMMVLRFPTQSLISRLDDPERYIGRALDARIGSSRVLTAFLRSVWETAEFDDHFESVLPDIVFDMMASALRPCVPQNEPVERRLASIKAYIDEHICDPCLRPSSVAKAMCMASRPMQMIFARAGTTVTEYIVRRRLDLAAEQLKQPEKRINITQLAYDIGFSDLTYFSKSFKRRFGVPPRDYRLLRH